MDVIQFYCSTCGRKICVSARFAGKQGQCSTCNFRFIVPQPLETPPAGLSDSGGVQGSPDYSCAKCGRDIAPHEQPYEWGDVIVCPECCVQLQANEAAQQAQQSQPPVTTVRPKSKVDRSGNGKPGPIRILFGFIMCALILCVILFLCFFIFHKKHRQLDIYSLPYREQAMAKSKFEQCPDGCKTLRDYKNWIPKELTDSYETGTNSQGNAIYKWTYGQQKKQQIVLVERGGSIIQINVIFHIAGDVADDADSLAQSARILLLIEGMATDYLTGAELQEITGWILNNSEKTGASKSFQGGITLIIDKVVHAEDGHYVLINIY